jgi:hypothetical protein
MNAHHVILAVAVAAVFTACKGSAGTEGAAADGDGGGITPAGDAAVSLDASGDAPSDTGTVDADASPLSDGGPSDAGDAGAGVQSTCTATATQVTCADSQATAVCALMPRSCTAGGSPYSGTGSIHLVNDNGGTCQALEAPFPTDGGVSGASCVESMDCALVCCGCQKPSWIFATALCVQGHCAAPALACAWGYAEDPFVCGPP